MTARTLSIWLCLTALAPGPFAVAAQPLGCLIEPSRVVEVGSPVIAVLESVEVERGQRVAKGQVVALLRADVEQAAVGVAETRARITAEVQAAQSNYDLARQKAARAEELKERNFISAQALEQARTEADVARQKLTQAREQRAIWNRELRLAEAQLRQRTIRSPADGVVVERYMNGGERVEEKPVVRIATVDPLRVELVISASLYGTVSVGSLLTVTPDLPNAAPRTAKVVLVDSVIDGPSNTFRARLELPNPNYELPAGVRCRVDLAGEAAPAASVAPARDTRDNRLRLDRSLPPEKPGVR